MTAAGAPTITLIGVPEVTIQIDRFLARVKIGRLFLVGKGHPERQGRTAQRCSQ